MTLRGAATALGELRRRIGSPEQLVRVDRGELTEGPAAGAPVLLVRNPGGVSFELLLDRALDVGWADALGIPLAWAAPAGRVASTRHEPVGTGWTRTFGGGLLSTCGLAATGAPSVVDGVSHGLHGRVGHLPAQNVRWRVRGEGAQAHVEIRGDVVESALGAPELRMSRTVRAWLDRPVLEIEDLVINDGFTDAGHMFRHHLNLGYPLVDDEATIVTDATVVGVRDGAPVASLRDLDLAVSAAPVDERVIYADSGPDARVTLRSPVAGAELEIVWSADTFPLLIAWRDASPGVNVLGIEPSTSRDAGRAHAQRTGELIVLGPQESRRYRTRLTVRSVGGG